ncbi:MAG TPA: hypothetical protein PLZ86_06565, partial [bacterium]|nr:hypothetical protein [bacterium]
LVVKAGNVGGWNGREILKGLGVTRQETLESAYAYHERYFFDPIRRASSLPIKGPIKLVKMLDRMLAERGIPLRKIFITLRNAKDDSLPDGTSSSEVSLRKNGIFDENSLILRYDGVIDWSEEAYKNPKHEPEKWEMAAKFRKKNPDVWFVGAFDNATAHINGYKNIFGHNIVSVHIKGDLPPNSPSLVDGVYTIDPWQLGREISELGGVSHPDLSRPPQPLSGPAFAPMLDAIRAAWGSGKRPVVAVDIDDTLFASSKRAKRILSDFLSEWMPGSSWVADFVSKYIPSQVEYGPNHILSQAGLGHLGFGNTFNDYFSRRFMGPEEAHRISVRQGALNVLLALQSLGVRIIYMSGRSDNPYVRNDTAYQLKALGFPVDDFGVELVMRQDLQKSDEDFKGDALAGLVGPFDSLVGVFDNEPGVLSNINRRFSMAPLYLVGDRQSAGTKPPPEGTLPVANFLGKTGRMPLPGNVQMGESMRLEGFSLSREFAAKMDEYRQLEASFKDGDASRSARMSKLLSSSASILKRISSLDAAHPMHAAFVLCLNGLFDGVPESIERHTEGFIDEINRGRKDPFVLLRTQEGIMQIAATRQGKIDVRLYKSHAPFIKPSPLPILKDAAGINLISALSVIPSGPVLPGKSGEFHYNAMMFGALTDTFPRMGFAFSWVVGSILSWKGGDAGDLFALEYSPGISLGNMIAMARMGVRVGWHEPDLARRLQTEHAISHLPMDLQAKIRYSGNDRKNRRADIVVLNSPHAKGFEQVAKKHFGGVVVSQSGSSAAKLMGKIPEDGNWALIGETELGEGEYVLPPNCMPNKPSSAHVPSGYFQVWRSVR